MPCSRAVLWNRSQISLQKNKQTKHQQEPHFHFLTANKKLPDEVHFQQTLGYKPFLVPKKCEQKFEVPYSVPNNLTNSMSFCKYQNSPSVMVDECPVTPQSLKVTVYHKLILVVVHPMTFLKDILTIVTSHKIVLEP
jgi:hypothetical protein